MNKEYLTFSPISINTYSVIFKDNNVIIGDLVREIDGYWVFYPTSVGAAYSDYVLFAIHQKMLSLNNDISKEINTSFQ